MDMDIDMDIDIDIDIDMDMGMDMEGWNPLYPPYRLAPLFALQFAPHTPSQRSAQKNKEKNFLI
jgi:hypothetical protein